MPTPNEITIENNFKFHSVDADKQEIMQMIREALKKVSLLVDDACPISREKSLAQTKLEEAMFWANAAISRNQ